MPKKVKKAKEHLVIVEIPKGSRNKYEYDEKLKGFRLSKTLRTSVCYPCDYGFFSDTLATDGDPLDALVLVAEPTFTGCHIKVRPVGVLRVKDRGEADNKVLCVAVGDPVFGDIDKLNQVPSALLDEIEHFFVVYKQLEKKKVCVKGWAKQSVALREVRKCFKARGK